jgi:6-phosphogluconolactonase (cycloisomerase 2 family)
LTFFVGTIILFSPKIVNMKLRLLTAVTGTAMLLGLASCKKNPGGPEGTDGGKIVYTISNDYHDNANAVLAYRQQADGTLAALPGSPFLTGGSGVANPNEILGPDDSDNPIAISADGQFLLAVNGGSNTIAVFSINPNGSLTPVAGSPFASGGQTPCSVAINGRFVYVANKSLDPLHTITTAPNYTTFTVDGGGRLTQVPFGQVQVAAGSSPSQVLVSNDQRYLFATDFLAFMLPTEMENPIGTLLSFSLQGTGGLKLAAGAPYSVPAGDGGALGLAQNPRSQTLYVGFPVASAFGVYSIDEAMGVLTFETKVAGGPATCWLRTNAQGTRLYTLNSGENSVGVYNVENPDAPVFMAKLFLKDSGPAVAGGTSPSSGDFSLGFAPDGLTLYVVSQSVNPVFTVGDFNYLHVLKVGTDGTLSEPTDPTMLPVSADVRPQGVATR